MSHRPSHERVGQLLAGRFRLLQLLGQGPAGPAFLAHDETLSSPAALKLVDSEGSWGSVSREDLAELCERVTALRHPGLVVPYEVGTCDDGQVFLASETVAASHLGDHPEASVATVSRWAEEALDALATLHTNGVHHGNLKPHNVLLACENDGLLHVRLADFSPVEGTSRQADLRRLAALFLGVLGADPEHLDEVSLAQRGDEQANQDGTLPSDPRAALTEQLVRTFGAQAWPSAEALAEAIRGRPSNEAAARHAQPGDCSTVADLLRACDAIVSAALPDAVLRALPVRAAELVNARAVVVVRRRQRGRYVHVVRAGPLADLSLPEISAAVRGAISDPLGEGVLFEDLLGQANPDLAPPLTWHAVVPARWGESTVAIVASGSAEPKPSPTDLARLKVFGIVAGAALERARTRRGMLDETACRAAILELVRDAVLVVGTQGIVRGVSREAAELLDVHRDAIVGRSIRDVPALSGMSLVLAWNRPVDGEIVPLPTGQFLVRARPFPAGVVVRMERLAASSRPRRIRTWSRPHKRRFNDFVGSAPALLGALRRARKVAKRDRAVLITGEPGTGRKMLAEAIHHASNRSNRPFAVVRARALLSQELEEQLYGHEVESVTGTGESRWMPGKVELANGGTLVVDGIESLPLGLQERLLMLIREGHMSRGETGERVAVDTRVLGIASRPLAECVREDTVRLALAEELGATTLELPPLRERRGDILPLLEHFVKHFSASFGRTTVDISPGVVVELQRYSWPGNVRELASLVEAWMGLLPTDQSKIVRTPSHIRRALRMSM